MRNTFINTIIESCQVRDDIFIISGDAGLGVFDEFSDKYRDRFLNMGIAEQNLTSFAAGMAIANHKVVIYNITPFLLYRCYEQVRNDICYHELPIILAGIGSGLTYAPQGMTHYSVEDIGIAGTLPNLTIISPADPVEARLAAQYSLKSRTPVYVRLAKRGEPVIHENEIFDITVPQIIRDGSDVAILFHGSVSVEVMKAGDELAKENIYPRIISIPMIQPLNEVILLEMMEDIKFVISVEEHYESCGLGNILNEIKTRYGTGWRLKKLGIPHRFVHEVKDPEGMRKYFGIDHNNVVETVRKIYGCLQ